MDKHRNCAQLLSLAFLLMKEAAKTTIPALCAALCSLKASRGDKASAAKHCACLTEGETTRLHNEAKSSHRTQETEP